MPQNWEEIVKKQLKTEDIYSILYKENVEDISVKPYYDSANKTVSLLPKVVESTHLVARYNEGLEEDVFAFLLDSQIPNLAEKTLFISEQNSLDSLEFLKENQYFSLIEVFHPTTGELDKTLAKRLLSLPFQRSISINISLPQNAGASIIQQLAIALAKTKELTEVFGESILSQLVFRVAVSAHYFFEISKIRALKLLFMTFAQEFHKKEIPFIFVETSQRNKSQLDPENNLIRSTLELSAAMIGGADAVFSHHFKLVNPDALSGEISFKQQIVLAYESIINVFEDAPNGSYYIESITQQIAEKAWKLFLEIENNGGYTKMMQTGEIQEIIYQQAIKEQNWVAEKKIKLIGINMYPDLSPKKTTEEMYSKTNIKPVRWAEMYE